MADFGLTIAQATGQSLANCVYSELDNFPAPGGSLDSISFYIGTVAATPSVRVALYSGGSAGNPNGASLVEDLGVVVATAGAAWTTKASTTNPTLVEGTKYWLAVKSNDAGSGVYSGADPGSNNLTGVRITTTGESGDETDAWDATVPGAGTSATRYFSMYLTYTPTPASSIVNVDTDNSVLDGQASVVINTTGITTATATVNLKTSTDSVSDAQSVASTTANSITLTSIVVADVPLTTAGYQLQIEVVCNEGTFEKNVTVGASTGKSVVQVDTTPIITLVGGYITSIFYGYSGTAPAVGDQIEYDTVDSGGNAITMANSSGGVDGQFSIVGSDTATTFSVRWWSAAGLIWSAEVILTVDDGIILNNNVQVTTKSSLRIRNRLLLFP